MNSCESLETTRQEFLEQTRQHNYWRQRWENGRFVYATTQNEWEVWLVARKFYKKDTEELP